MQSSPLHDPIASAPPLGTCETRTTTCYMCACRCGIRVHLRQGENGPEVRYIDGNPDHPLNKGVICAKGSSGIMKQYSPARLLKPLKRKAGAAVFVYPSPVGGDYCQDRVVRPAGPCRRRQIDPCSCTEEVR